MNDKIKKRVRELQALGEGVVSYQACLNLFLEHGFDEAKRRVLAMTKSGSGP